MKNGKQYLNSAKGWQGGIFRKTTKEKGGFYRAGFKGEDPGHHKMRSMDSTGEKHIVLCFHFQDPAPKVGQAGGLKWGLGLPPGPQIWGSPKLAPLQGSPPTAYALPLPIYLYSFHFVPTALILGCLVSEKYRKGSFLSKSPFSVQSPNSSPREWCEFQGEAQFRSSCCYIRRISFWAESLKRDKYT